MSAILLNPDVLIFKDPTARSGISAGKGHPHKYWADRGLIHIEDMTTGAYTAITVVDALRRVKAVNDMLGNRGDGLTQFADERQQYQNFIDGLIELCKKARDQGMPDDPAHTKQKAQEIKAARQSRLLVNPSPLARF